MGKHSYLDTDLPDYLAMDMWSAEDGLLLIAGLSPKGAIVDWGYKNDIGENVDYAIIRQAQPLDGESWVFTVSTKRELAVEMQALKQYLSIRKALAVDLPADSPMTVELRKKKARLGMLETMYDSERSQIAESSKESYESTLTQVWRNWEKIDHDGLQHEKQVFVLLARGSNVKIEWLAWAIENGYLPKALDDDQDQREASVEPAATSELESSANYTNKHDDLLVDPWPLSRVAIEFRLNVDKYKNLGTWKKLAAKASRNGLGLARITRGKGRAQSTFNPIAVVDWLVDRGHITRYKADRKLAKALPHLKHHFTQ